jgi:hypothetical protein
VKENSAIALHRNASAFNTSLNVWLSSGALAPVAGAESSPRLPYFLVPCLATLLHSSHSKAEAI